MICNIYNCRQLLSNLSPTMWKWDNVYVAGKIEGEIIPTKSIFILLMRLRLWYHSDGVMVFMVSLFINHPWLLIFSLPAHISTLCQRVAFLKNLLRAKLNWHFLLQYLDAFITFRCVITLRCIIIFRCIIIKYCIIFFEAFI